MARAKRVSKDDLETTAAIEFDPMELGTSKIMSRSQFMANADVAYTFLVIGAHLLTKDRDDLTGCMRHLGTADSISAVEEVVQTKNWLETLHEIAEVVTARLIVATARAAMQEGA